MNIYADQLTEISGIQVLLNCNQQYRLLRIFKYQDGRYSPMYINETGALQDTIEYFTTMDECELAISKYLLLQKD